MKRRASILLVLCAAVACRKTGDAERGSAGSSGTSATVITSASALAAGTATSASRAAGASDGEYLAYDLARDTSSCVAGVRGTFIDVGSSTTDAAVEPERGKRTDETIEREGATWLRVRDRSITLSFLESEERTGDIVVSLRLRGGAARAASVSINDHAIGVARITHEETQVVHATGHVTLHKGMNEVSLRFTGVAGSGLAPFVDLDWVHVGMPAVSAGATNDAGAAPVVAPGSATNQPLIASPPPLVGPVTIGRESKNAFSLAGGGFVRCLVYLPPGMRLRFSAASQGGSGELTVTAYRDRTDPETLTSAPIAATSDRFAPVTLTASGPPRPAIVEFRATAAKGARVIVAEPRIFDPRASARAATPASPAVRGVVLVVASALPPRALGAYNGPGHYDDFIKAARVEHIAHRATSPFAGPNLASMLTGQSAIDLGMRDGMSTVPRNVRSLGDVLREGSVATAMFTANPETFPAFGFGRGMEKFAAVSPTESNPAQRLVDLAKAFVDEHKAGRFFIVLHTRGAHPPWDVKREQLRTMRPENYGGPLDPEQAGIVLARAARNQLRLTDADRERATALADVAIESEGRALADLRASLKALKRDSDTAWILTSDTGFDPGANVPYLAADSVDESRLRLPLEVWPQEVFGKDEDEPTDTADIAPTVLAAFGLSLPEGMRGRAIGARGLDGALAERTRIAVTQKRVSLRLGDYVLVKTSDRDAKFCSLELEPACLADVRATHPIGYALLHRTMLVRERAASQRERGTADRAVLDPVTQTMLEAWGTATSNK